MVTQPLDFVEIFLNHVTGSPVIFWILCLIAIVYLAAQFRMPIGAISIFVLIFSMIMISGVEGLPESTTIRSFVYIGAILLGIISGVVLKRIVGRQ